MSCGAEPTLYGEPADHAMLEAQVRPIAVALQAGGEVTVRGSIGSVCEMGCWFYLLDDEELLYIKLDLASSLIIPPDSKGREALVRGVLEGEGAERELVAKSVVIY